MNVTERVGRILSNAVGLEYDMSEHLSALMHNSYRGNYLFNNEDFSSCWDVRFAELSLSERRLQEHVNEAVACWNEQEEAEEDVIVIEYCEEL